MRWGWRAALLSGLVALGCDGNEPARPEAGAGGAGGGSEAGHADAAAQDSGGASSVGGASGTGIGGTGAVGRAPDGGVSGGMTDAGGAGGASGMGGASVTGGSGALPADTGACPTGLVGPVLVNVPAPAGSPVTSYCMDSTEVTNAQHAVFLAASVPASGQDAWCSWNASYTPSSGWPATGKDDHPVVYVDWCDAYAHCKWAGKHLCGKIGGGANAYVDYRDAAKSAWFNACSAGGTLTYPYGDTYSGTACVGNDYDGTPGFPSGSDMTRTVGTASCEGGYGGLYDLTGNVWEWEDSCDGATGSSDRCLMRGSSFSGNSSDLRCDAGIDAVVRAYDSGYLGFRCCSASL